VRPPFADVAHQDDLRSRFRCGARSTPDQGELSEIDERVVRHERCDDPHATAPQPIRGGRHGREYFFHRDIEAVLAEALLNP
jgi:hypothetical protein